MTAVRTLSLAATTFVAIAGCRGAGGPKVALRDITMVMTQQTALPLTGAT